MAALVRIQVGRKLYLRDPDETILGRKIVSESIKLIDELGFDAFTFKKLAKEIASTEASVYRYFSSKQQLLQYLVAWYWSALEYVLDYRTNNVTSPLEKLRIAISVLAESDKDNPMTTNIDEALLHRIIVAESARVYLTKQQDAEGAAELSRGQDRLSKRLSDILREISPKYPHTSELALSLITVVHKQIFAKTYGSGSRGRKLSAKDRETIKEFARHLVLKALDVE